AADNSSAVEELERHNGSPAQIAARDQSFPGQSITLGGAPAWMKDGFAGLVTDGGRLYLRAAHLARMKEPVMVISSVAFDRKILAKVAASSKLGSLTMTERFETRKPDASESSTAPTNENTGLMSAGTVPPPAFRLDWGMPFGGIIQVVDWKTGESD